MLRSTSLTPLPKIKAQTTSISNTHPYTSPKRKTMGVSQLGLAIYIKKSILRQKKNYRNSNISPCKNRSSIVEWCSPDKPNMKWARQALACVGPHFIPVKPQGFTEHKDQCWVGITEIGLRVSAKCINIRASQGNIKFGHTLCAILAVSSLICVRAVLKNRIWSGL